MWIKLNSKAINKLDCVINLRNFKKLTFVLNKCAACFIIRGSKEAMMQFQIVLGMISKIKTTRHTREL